MSRGQGPATNQNPCRGEIRSMGRVWADGEGAGLEEKIFRALFPNDECEWEGFAKQKGCSVEDKGSSVFFKWNNQIIDAQMFWAHYINNRKLFVSDDRNFRRKLSTHPDFGRAIFVKPSEVVMMLHQY